MSTWMNFVVSRHEVKSLYCYYTLFILFTLVAKHGYRGEQLVLLIVLLLL